MPDPVIAASLRSASKNAVSENLLDRNSQLHRERPDISAKLKVHLSNFAFVRTTLFEIALEKTVPWKFAPRKLQSTARKLYGSQSSKELTEKLHFHGSKVAEGESATALAFAAEENTVRKVRADELATGEARRPARRHLGSITTDCREMAGAPGFTIIDMISENTKVPSKIPWIKNRTRVGEIAFFSIFVCPASLLQLIDPNYS